jgi:NAD(P)-dependent dehydrogenase (short-subunit alcohol dehydrogenase family)
VRSSPTWVVRGTARSFCLGCPFLLRGGYGPIPAQSRLEWASSGVTVNSVAPAYITPGELCRRPGAFGGRRLGAARFTRTDSSRQDPRPTAKTTRSGARGVAETSYTASNVADARSRRRTYGHAGA